MDGYNALIGRLRHGDTMDASRALADIIERGHPLDEASRIAAIRIEAGVYILDEPLTALVARGKFEALYDALRERFFRNEWSLLKLYQEHYPDWRIEDKLCELLYKVASDDGDARRRYIAEAMKDVGSLEVLPTLEALLGDLGPSAKIQQVFLDQLDLLGHLRAQSRIDFTGLLADTIDEVRARGRSRDHIDMEVQTPTRLETPQTEVTTSAVTYKSKAQSHLSNDAEAAVNYLRKGAEELAKEAYRTLGFERDGKSARNMLLGELLKALKDSECPTPLLLLLEYLKLFGNYGSHDQDGEQSEHLTSNIVAPVIGIYELAIECHQKWILRQKQSLS